ncbi:Fanconi anemia complementation group I [Xylocopa sonorina]|uniref:Fanconi anemia complementation group I n=1 Tax=Xylocopa sonorina TaxID=1818115 RepID=UPI00403AF03E
MHHRLENLRERGDRLGLRAFVQDLNAGELVQLAHSIVCKPDATKILDDVLESFSDSDSCQLKRRKFVETTLKSLEKAKISVGQANTIINRIIFDFPKYSKQHHAKFVDFCITNIRNNESELHSWKDLLPVLLETLENEKYIIYEDAEVSGIEYKSLIVKAICSSEWNVNLLPSLTKMFGDMRLEKTDRNLVLNKLCFNLPNLSLDQVPSFVYQALKLCKDKDNQKLLSALSTYFDSCYSKTISTNDRDSFEDIGMISKKEVRDIESTVLYHVYQAARLNHEHMKDFIRFLKQTSHASEYILQPFILAVLMSITSIYEDQIFEILKVAIVNSNLEKEKRQCSAWLRQCIPSPPNVIEIILQVIDTSNKDRHLVLKGLVGLAFILMSADQKSKNGATATWPIGSKIIQKIAKKRHETIPVVLEELITKIVIGNSSTTHYTECLKYMCRELSIIVLDHQVLIMTILERLLFLPSTIATQVLNAIFPLMRVSPNIRENIILTLRKALYRKGISKRQMAVTGFLEMLKYSKMYSRNSFRLSQHSSSSSFRSTQTQVTLEYNSQQERPTTEREQTLCYEILDILKKSFTYEFEVRLHLYEGLHDAVAKNPNITEVLLDMLLSHLNLYLDTDESILPPVKFELCTDLRGMDVVQQEPIAHLIFSLQKIYNNAVAKESNICRKLYDTLKALCRRMMAMKLEHLNLEYGADLFHGDLSKSQIKLRTLHASIGIYEALIAFRIGERLNGDRDSFHQINDLFNVYTELMDFIKAQSTKTKKVNGKNKKNKDANTTIKKSAKSNDVKIPQTIMDLDVIRQSLLLLFPQTMTQDNCIVRKNYNFCYYILQTCEQLLQCVRSFTNDASQIQSKQHLNTYIEVGSLLYKHFIKNLNDALVNDEKMTILALQCFKEISYSMCTLFSSELPKFLNSIFEVQSNKDSTSVDINSQLEKIIFSLIPYLETEFVKETDDEEEKKVPFLLLQTIEQFTYKINFDNYNPQKIIKRIKAMIQMEDVQSSIIPGIVQFYLNLEGRTEEYGETLNDICLELCEKVGSIDGSEPVTSSQYKVIRDDTALQIYNILNSDIKEQLNSASWLLMRLKAEDTIARAPGTIDEFGNNNLREKERSLCKQLSYLAQELHTLASTAIKPGPSTDATLKNLQILYHLLGNLTKYFYVKSNAQNAAFQAVKFIQVVQLAGKSLKTAFYNLVMYVEESQNKLNSKTDSSAQRNKILRETKTIPRVVYEIEQFNKEILLLGKRTAIPLEKYIKQSVTRDFRIKNPQLVEGLEKMDVSMLVSPDVETSENDMHTSNVDETESNSDDETSSTKRCRMED